jgi:hypothetical protein
LFLASASSIPPLSLSNPPTVVYSLFSFPTGEEVKRQNYTLNPQLRDKPNDR